MNVRPPRLSSLQSSFEAVPNLLARLKHRRKEVQVGMDRRRTRGLPLVRDGRRGVDGRNNRDQLVEPVSPREVTRRVGWL